MLRYLLPSALSLMVLACASRPQTVVHHIVTSKIPYPCCRTIRYATWPLPSTRPSGTAGEGVIVRLLADTLAARCESDAELGLLIANNSDLDIYIPISNELEGDRIKLYPWRVFNLDGNETRLARQLQYNDIIEREDALARFFRLPSGEEVQFRGVIPQRWLCSPLTGVSEEYMGLELNPTFYADRSRSLRGAAYRRDPELRRSIGLVYEIAYTTLTYLDSLPVSRREWNPANDTVQVQIELNEEPAQFLNASQRTARSNVVQLRIVE